MERKLASVQIVHKIEPIDGADRIELAHVLGWQCVVKKGDFKEGDKCVYCEIDSFLPVKEEFEFLRNSSYKKSELLGEGFRIKTQKMRGQLSQGLVITQKQLVDMGIDISVMEVGSDVTELLGIKKYEIPERATSGGTIIGELGGEVSKTDETRVQNAEDILPEFTGLDYYISTKIDGSSHSISIDKDGVFHVYGHNYEYADDGHSSFYEFVKKHHFEEKLRKAMHDDWDSIVVQGEWAGPGLQKNRLKLVTADWFVFTLIINGERRPLGDMLDICDKIGCKSVPIEEIGTDLLSEYSSIDAILKRAEGSYPNGGPKEGIVIRPLIPVWSDKIGDWLSIKAVSNKYLLKNSD